MKKVEYCEECFAILFDVVYINENLFLYVPNNLIEGELFYDKDFDQEYFVSILGFQNLLMNDYAVVEEQVSSCVGYLISKKDLLERYLEVPEKEAISQYYNEISSEIHFGIYTLDEEYQESIQIFNIDCENFSDKLLKNLVDEITIHSTKEVNHEIPKKEQELLLALTSKCLEDILNSKDFDTMKKKVQEIYDAYMKSLKSFENSKILDQSVFQDKTLVDDQLIQLFFDTYYQYFYYTLDHSEFQQRLTVFLENVKDLSNNLKEEQAFDISSLDSFVSTSEKFLKLDDLKLARLEICSSLDELQPIIRNIQNYYLEKKNQLTLKKGKVENCIDNLLDSKFYIRQIRSYLDDYVIGQEVAKQRIVSSMVRNFIADTPSFKNTFLLIGPTGSGKTFIVDVLFRYFNLPMVKIDSTQITKAGYKGADIEIYLERLLASANGDLERAKRGVVLFDEIDKKATEEDDVAGKSVLDMLLLFIEGTTYNITYKNRPVIFDTSNLTIAATGSFETMVRKLKNSSNQYQSTRIGFGSNLKETENCDIVYPKITLDNLREYGNLPSELIGRIPVIVQLEGHTKNSLMRILNEGKFNALLAEKEVFKKMNVELQWTQGYLEAVAEKALSLKEGARSLKTIVEDSVWAARDEVINGYYENRCYKSVVLTENTVIDNTDCEFIDFFGTSVVLRDVLNSQKEVVKEKRIEMINN